MRKDVISLQFYERDQSLNRLNPLSKFLGLISLSITLFLSNDVWVHMGIFLVCILLFISTRFSFSKLQGAKTVILTTIFIAALHVFFEKDGSAFVTIGKYSLTDKALTQAVSAATRFVSVIMLSYLFILTTDPGGFVLSLVDLGLPYRFGYTLITSLRMIPMVKNEVKRISFAQISRGFSYRLFPVRKFNRNVGRFLKVVLISMLERVNRLVISMEGRSFGLFNTRTTLSKVEYQWPDYILFGCSAGLIILSIIW